ncbi:hypothetical protein J2X68_002442 [Streptomyces sp. 3330]|nr:hypothetical protein [Streptomyces sp. 3330]
MLVRDRFFYGALEKSSTAARTAPGATPSGGRGDALPARRDARRRALKVSLRARRRRAQLRSAGSTTNTGISRSVFFW